MSAAVQSLQKVFSFKEDFSKHLSYKAVTKDLINKIITVKSSPSAGVENATIFYSPKKTQSKMRSTLMFVIMGLTGLFLIVIIMYIFTGLLEKFLVNTNTV